jgi:hypothetical protein
MTEPTIIDALKYFNTEITDWYGWSDTGEMTYDKIFLRNSDATLPTEEEVTDKLEELTVEYNRFVAYPDLREQLDKLFHDIDGGLLGEDAKTGSLYLALKEVKDNNPKPSE